jgi:hypothetical protein
MLPQGNEYPGLYRTGTVAARQPRQKSTKRIGEKKIVTLFQTSSLQGIWLLSYLIKTRTGV